MTARDLPVGMLYEVADVLEAHGLQLRAAAEQRPELWAVLLTALGQVVDAVPVEHGGRFGETVPSCRTEPGVDGGSGLGWSPDQ